jgi:hypothetical protein
MSLTLGPRLLAVLAGAAVLAAGSTYTLLRPQRFASQASLVVVTRDAAAESAPTVADSFDRAGVAGTLVEVFSSPQTLADAGAPPAEVSARAVPASRVITVRTTGAHAVVQRALTAVIAAGRVEARTVDRLWSTHVLERPSAPERAGPPLVALLVAVVLLAVLAASATGALTKRLFDGASRITEGSSYDDRQAEVPTATPLPTAVSSEPREARR